MTGHCIKNFSSCNLCIKEARSFYKFDNNPKNLHDNQKWAVKPNETFLNYHW